MLHSVSVAFLAALGLLPVLLPGQDDKPKSRADERTVASLPQSRYFLLSPRNLDPMSAGRPLLVVMPGGDASAEILPFVENVICAQAPDSAYAVMIVAPKWTKEQAVVWPTAKSPEKRMQYTTEEYVRAVIKQACDSSPRRIPIDRSKVYLLAWSSAGPAVYALLAGKDAPCRGAYVAMSIFPPVDKTALACTKGLRIVLDHSPQDDVTKFVHCRRAYDALTEAGAVVQLSTYLGGHGWNDDPAPRLRRNLTWLMSDEAASAPNWPDSSAK